MHFVYGWNIELVIGGIVVTNIGLLHVSKLQMYLASS